MTFGSRMDESDKNESPVSENESPVSNTLTVGTKFQSFVELKNELDHFQKANFSQLYVRDSRILQQAKQSCPTLVRAVPEELKYIFITYSCIHGGRCFKSRPKTRTRPQQM